MITNLTCVKHLNSSGQSRCTVCGEPATHTAINEIDWQPGQRYRQLCDTHAEEFRRNYLGIHGADEKDPAAPPAAAQAQTINKPRRKARKAKGAA